MYSNCLFVALAIMVFFNNDALLNKYGKHTCDVWGLFSFYFILFYLSIMIKRACCIRHDYSQLDGTRPFRSLVQKLLIIDHN